MKSYYYMDCLHREIFLEEEDIQAVPESGRADEACSAIAGKPYVVEQFMADSFRTLKDAASHLCDSPDVKSRPACRTPPRRSDVYRVDGGTGHKGTADPAPWRSRRQGNP